MPEDRVHAEGLFAIGVTRRSTTTEPSATLQTGRSGPTYDAAAA